MTVSITPAERFRSYVDVRGPDECWPWTGCVDKDGYGQLSFLGKKTARAHRVAFFLEHGRWPEPCGLHSCDNPPCCNPRHIWEGTNADNHADMVAKKRHPIGDRNGARRHPETRRGERNGRAKLTRKQALRLRRRRGVTSCAAAAREFGVSRRTVARVWTGENWRCLDAR